MIDFPNPETEHIREDRYTFEWAFEDAPRFMVDRGWGDSPKPYEVAITYLRANFSPEGELLDARAAGSKVKKDGTRALTSASLPYRWEEKHLYDALREWRAHR